MDIKNIYELHYAMRMGIYHRDLKIEFQKRIIDYIEEEIFVTDEYGFIQFLNPYAEKVCGVALSDVIGWHVDELENRGIISSSITKEVFRNKKICNRMMELHTGETVLATGIPLYDRNGNLSNVLATSKNLEEMHKVLTNLHELTSELDKKESELKELRQHFLAREHYIMESPAMREVEEKIIKVAPTDVTVLVEGESGAGKEVVADLIHKYSNRRDKPFIKINCAMIPEHLL
ncbi:MAG: sigma 54-interacting transcriptional regulator, partial [Firmicutes bacterium]|nr:sigma 54-interacting transcriptional regulator [Bacillota bacterium]